MKAQVKARAAAVAWNEKRRMVRVLDWQITGRVCIGGVILAAGLGFFQGCDERQIPEASRRTTPGSNTTRPAVAPAEPSASQRADQPGSQPATQPAENLTPFTFRQIHMAMPVEISLWAASEQQAQTAAKAAFAQVGRIDRLMNDYVPDTEISRLSERAGKGPVKVSDDMMTVLAKAREVWELTEGAFDPTAAPVVQLWREAAKTGEFPDEQTLAEARRRVGMDKVKLDPAAGTVELTQPGMRLDFGGIAKGYACDLATQTLLEHGITVTYVQAGGDMVLGDAPPETDGWLIDVPGHEPMTLSNTAISISGDTARFAIVNGVRYSHVVDPRTGVGVTSRQMAVVMAPQGVLSDPLATAGCVLAPEEFQEIIASMPDVKALVFIAPEEESVELPVSQ